MLPIFRGQNQQREGSGNVKPVVSPGSAWLPVFRLDDIALSSSGLSVGTNIAVDVEKSTRTAASAFPPGLKTSRSSILPLDIIKVINSGLGSTELRGSKGQQSNCGVQPSLRTARTMSPFCEQWICSLCSGSRHRLLHLRRRIKAHGHTAPLWV